MRDVILTDFSQKQPPTTLARGLQRIAKVVETSERPPQTVRLQAIWCAAGLFQNFRFVPFVFVVPGAFPAKLAP